MILLSATGCIGSVLYSLMVIMIWMTIESSIVSSSSLAEELSQKHQNDDIVALFDAINRLVEFFTADPEARTANAKLGMLIARVQLESIVATADCIRQRETAEQVKGLVEMLLQKLSAMLSVDHTEIFSPNSENSKDHGSDELFGGIVARKLLQPRLWSSSTPIVDPSAKAINRFHTQQLLRLGKLDQSLSATPPLGQTKTMPDYDHLFDHIDQGLPTAYDSDTCLAEILNGLPESGCILSSRCVDGVMALNGSSFGYHLTHKLLYYMILNQCGCASSLPISQSIGSTIPELCQQILAELTLISSVGYPRDMRDLVIEQTFLCAHNGFAEFYAKPLINEILSWQKTDISCYAFDVFGPDTDPLNWKQRFETDKKNKRNRRSALQLKHNCSDHMSGLALATLTQYLKFRINYYKITEN